MTRFLVPAALLALLSGCIDTSSEDAREMSAEPFTPTQEMMPDYCRQQAAERFDVVPGDITTANAEPAGDLVTVAGSAANGVLVFTCTFTADGEFLGLETA